MGRTSAAPHLGSIACCARCGRLRRMHGWGCCNACYQSLWQQGCRAVRTGRWRCVNCGLRRQELAYAWLHWVRGCCPACYARWQRGDTTVPILPRRRELQWTLSQALVLACSMSTGG